MIVEEMTGATVIVTATMTKGGPMKIYKVGGYVRDTLLDLYPNDTDYVVVGATVEEFKKSFCGGSVEQVGKDFPVFLVDGEEYAFARVERKVTPGYDGFECDFDPSVTLAADLYRRDLTINAMAMDENGDIIDPYGGQLDLEDKVLRHVSPAFAEDPLRVLRVARFAARFPDFTVHPPTLKLMRELRDELHTISPERVWKETERALRMPAPWRFFQILKHVRALDVLFPELKALDNVPAGPVKYHGREDSLDHCLAVMKGLNDDSAILNFSALCHDIGKGLTPEEEWPSHKLHELNGPIQIDKMCDRLKAPNSFRKNAKLVAGYHMRVPRILEMKPKKAIPMLLEIDKFNNGIRGFMKIVSIDRKWNRTQSMNMRNFVWGAVDNIKRVKLPEEFRDLGEESGKKLLELRIKAYKDFKADFLNSRKVEVLTILEKLDSLTADATEILYEYIVIKYGKKARDRSTVYGIELDFESSKIEATLSIPGGCGCCYDDEFLKLPLSYLWEPNWKVDLEKEVAQEREARIARQEELEKQKREEIEKSEKQMYERLKKKFDK